ncbi:MAG TPA: gliding motility-associated C-terminal domain-containing protein [Flavobacteriales bacterium]|jgi:gliding motility-associated-like protein|nr:gliding motility-associated C-terminal domain-containing protein [Flavobacteriales bacterium]
MRTDHALLLIAGLWARGTAAQELVPNGGFEEYTACPDFISEIERATGWSRPTEGTSDYLNSCSIDPYASVPDNQFGSQAAHTGNAYAGFYAFSYCDPNIPMVDGYREYVTHALAAPMEIGRSYRVEFHVSLAEIASYAINDLGALFSTQPPHRTDDQVLLTAPHVTNEGASWLNDQDGWMTISGCFVADSAYTWITVGSFTDAMNTEFSEVIPSGNPYCYYYIDDISVQPGLQVELGPDIVTCGPVTLAVEEPEDDVEYHWSTGEIGTSITVDATGLYRVTASDSGCEVEDSVRVSTGTPVVITMATDTLVDFCAISTVRIGPDTLPLDAELRWSNGSTQPWIVVDQPGDYTIMVGGPDICESQATIRVVDVCAHPLFSPNAFTPNGDGINDVWRPVWTSNTDGLLTMEVYDRWGRVLFSSADGRDGWDGSAKGSPAPIGVYAYRLFALDVDAQVNSTYVGHVTLVR